MKVYNQKVLIIVEQIIFKTLLTRLANRGYRVFLASDVKEALVLFNKEKPEVVILDITLSKLDGYEVCRKIQQVSNVPIIVLTAINIISKHIQGLELNADSYIIKPFSAKELEIRLLSILKSSGNLTPPTSTKHTNKAIVENLVIEIGKRDLVNNNSKIKLTNIEFSIFKLLLENQGTQLSRNEILSNVWGFTPQRNVDTRIVDVHISRLRSKIEKDPAKPTIILTIRGLGYMLTKS